MIDTLTLSLAMLVACTAALLFAYARRQQATAATRAIFALYTLNYLTFFWAYALPSQAAEVMTLAFGALEGPVIWWLARTHASRAPDRPHSLHLALPTLLALTYPALAPDQIHWPFILLSLVRLGYALMALHILVVFKRQNHVAPWLAWVGMITLAALAISLIKLGAYGFYLFDQRWHAPNVLVLIKTIGASAVALALLWWALIRPEVYLGLGHTAAPARVATDLDSEILERFTDAMEREQAYTQEALSLAEMAHQIAVTPRELSDAINRAAGKSFKAMARQYRVAHACALLRDPACADNSVLEIALQSGFATKSVFNSAFKAETGTTPSAYRKQHLG